MAGPSSSFTAGSSSGSSRSFSAGELVWGPRGNFPSWPGKLLESAAAGEGQRQVRVCWFGSKEETAVPAAALKDLSDGLEAHHKERKRLRK